MTNTYFQDILLCCANALCSNIQDQADSCDNIARYHYLYWPDFKHAASLILEVYMRQSATVVCFTGISEDERRHRKASNALTTKITFVGWLLEVFSNSSYILFSSHVYKLYFISAYDSLNQLN